MTIDRPFLAERVSAATRIALMTAPPLPTDLSAVLESPGSCTTTSSLWAGRYPPDERLWLSANNKNKYYQSLFQLTIIDL